MSELAQAKSATDGRLIKGARARQRIARHTVDVASAEGLNGISFGRIAADLRLSKSSVQTLFRTKEALQLAAVEEAGQAFALAVVGPAQAAAEGAARMRALVDNWITYAQTPLFAGGCFWSANLPEFDSRPGAIRDALVRGHDGWLGLLADELRHAHTAGEIAELDCELAAFQIDAVLRAANTALRLGRRDSVDSVRRVVDSFLPAPR
ncbi:TetR/AcrR family transcriptional regulator [Streptomyces sp. NBC_01304]|uniref:TetR/AcrR family transcriptional regulator n=1 Tax=Streptomyces sp. NBC_01304 TaxID=2903818 RepID=UPI002E14B063|nr:TetR/AcrR family transcriptional regulator [Streptomyces sp. NBC_01304]